MNGTIRILMVLVAVAGVARAGEPPELARMRDRYDRQVRAAMTGPLQSYARDLENLAVRLGTQRDLDGAKQVQQELDRVKSKLAEIDRNPLLPSPKDEAREVATKNLVQNGGFETGTIEGWLPWGLDLLATKIEKNTRAGQGGRHLLKMKKGPDAGLAGIVQDLMGRAQPGQRVRGTASVKLRAGATDAMIFGVALKDATGKRILQLISQTAKGTGNWEELSFDFVVPTKQQQPDLGQIHLFVGFAENKDPGEAFVDEVVVMGE